MGQKTDGGFGILAVRFEVKTPSWYQSKAGRRQTGRLLELTVCERGSEGVDSSSSGE